jgi:hypothetical protein
MTDAPRPIWLTAEQRQRLTWVANLRGLPATSGIAHELLDAWDAAPADAEQAVRDALEEEGLTHMTTPSVTDEATRAVLAALGRKGNDD